MDKSLDQALCREREKNSQGYNDKAFFQSILKHSGNEYYSIVEKIEFIIRDRGNYVIPIRGKRNYITQSFFLRDGKLLT